MEGKTGKNRGCGNVRVGPALAHQRQASPAPPETPPQPVWMGKAKEEHAVTWKAYMKFTCLCPQVTSSALGHPQAQLSSRGGDRGPRAETPELASVATLSPPSAFAYSP